MDVINQLQQLDFRLYPLTEIDRLLSSLGKIGFMITDYHEKQKNGHEIEFERAVNNTKEEPEFNSVSRISFKPAEFKSKYAKKHNVLWLCSFRKGLRSGKIKI